MIRNDADLDFAIESLNELLQAYVDYRAKTVYVNPKTFALVAPSYTSEIASITEAISTYLNIPVVSLPDVFDVSIRLKGTAVKLGAFSASAVGSCLTHFQSGISRIATSRDVKSKKVAKEAKDACHFLLSGVGPGSVTIYLNAPQTDKSPIGDKSIAEFAIDELVDGIQECSAGPEEPEKQTTQDFGRNATRYQVFKALSELMPNDPAVDEVEIFFARRQDEDFPRALRVNRPLARKGKNWAKKIASAGIRETVTGQLVGINIRKRTLELIEQRGQRRILLGKFSEDNDEKVRPLIYGMVKISGVVRTIGSRRTIDLEDISADGETLDS